MSGLAGLVHLDGAPVEPGLIEQMTGAMAHRGPDGTKHWVKGSVALGQCMLHTTPESVHEALPLLHTESGCVVLADARLDNRDDLIRALGLPADEKERIGDGRLILEAYLAWGERCAARFLGDFAFALWDPRLRKLFCGRDHLGMRPLYYHHSPNRFLAFASEPKAILRFRQVPYRINEGRIADFLVNPLEGIDKISTFFEEVFRLPPAHTLIVTPQGMQRRRYWTLEPGPELRLASDEAYAEAFLDVFSEAVRCRLRGAGPVGSMLSGGMDSGSVVAVARGILAEEGRGPLPTFSGVGPDPHTCVETRSIQAAMTMEGLAPHRVNYEHLDDVMPELETLTWGIDEPFDNHMTLIRAIYVMARQEGVKVLLDGAAGDVVLSEGNYLAHLLRAGHWVTASREAALQNLFWGGNYPAWKELYRSARTAFIPDPIRRLRRRLQSGGTKRQFLNSIRDSLINPDFARRVRLNERLQAMRGTGASQLPKGYGWESARAVEHPFLTVGRERYGRVASAVGVEPRDPYLDLRLIDFCIRLPGRQKLCGGWPKIILRRAVKGRLPDAVRWRRGKEHLGWSFTQALLARTKEHFLIDIEARMKLTGPYIKRDEVQNTCAAYLKGAEGSEASKVYEAAHLCNWLHRHARRPTVEN